MRCTKHGLQEVWRAGRVSAKAIELFSKSGKFLLLAIVSVATALLVPTLVVRTAQNLGLYIPLSRAERLGRTLRKVVDVCIVFGLLFALARVCLISHQLSQESWNELKQKWVYPVTSPVVEAIRKNISPENFVSLVVAGFYTCYLSIKAYKS